MAGRLDLRDHIDSDEDFGNQQRSQIIFFNLASVRACLFIEIVYEIRGWFRLLANIEPL
jgi:hypothetical protein